MGILEELIRSGRIVDLMLVFVAIEVTILVAYHRRTGRGIAPLPLLLNVGAGTSLMLALRTVLTGAAWPLTAACLVLSLVFHTADLAARISARGTEKTPPG